MSFTFTEITAMANKAIQDELTAGVFKKSLLLKRIRKNQKLIDGGTSIVAPLMVVDDTGSTGAWYDTRDNISNDSYDGISASQHNWRRLHEVLTIYKGDLADASGKNAQINLLNGKLQQMEKAFRQRLTKGILSDGTAATGALTVKQAIGLDKFIQSSGSYGGFSSTDLSSWAATVDDNSGVNRALTKDIVDKSYDSTVDGEDGATLGIMDKNVFTKFKGLLTGIQRTTREDSLSNLGHKGHTIVYNGIDYIVDNLMKANTIFHIDEKHVQLYVHKDHNMRKESIKQLESSDALKEMVFIYCQIISRELKYNSRINDITV